MPAGLRAAVCSAGPGRCWPGWKRHSPRPSVRRPVIRPRRRHLPIVCGVTLRSAAISLMVSMPAERSRSACVLRPRARQSAARFCTVKARPHPPVIPRSPRIAAISSKVWSSRSSSISSTVAGAVVCCSVAVSGRGRVRVWCWPPVKRTWQRVAAVAGPGEGDVGDQQAEQALAFPHGGGGVVPQGREVAGQGQDAGLLLLIERDVGVAGAGVVVAGFGELAQPGVPVGFQVAGHQPVGGVDGQVAAPCGVGGVLGALHVGGADRVGLAGVGGQFGGDGSRRSAARAG